MSAKLYEALGVRIKAERRRAGLTQSTFAAKIGLSRAALGSIETGRQQLLVHHLVRIAIELHVDVDQLMGPETSSLEHLRPLVGAAVTAAQRLQITRLVAEYEAKTR